MRSLGVAAFGYMFKSRAELAWAFTLERLGLKWQYEPERLAYVECSEGMRRHYTPDFLVDGSHWLEVKGQYQYGAEYGAECDAFGLASYLESEEWRCRSQAIASHRVKSVFVAGNFWGGFWFPDIDEWGYPKGGIDEWVDRIAPGSFEGEDIFEEYWGLFSYPWPYLTPTARRIAQRESDPRYRGARVVSV